MKKILLGILILLLGAGSVDAFTDSLWIVGGEGYAGDLVTVEVWLQYEGAGGDEMFSAFTIPLMWNATACTVEAVSIGADFRNENWMNGSMIDNQGTMGPPAVAKACVASFLPGPVGMPAARGTHLAATVDFRILGTASSSDSACFDTLMSGFTPLIELGFWDEHGLVRYMPSFFTDCIRVLPYTDSLWIVGAQGYPGDLVSAEVWLQYEGGGYGDSITAFDIPLTWDASVCTVEAVTIAAYFSIWTDYIYVDNQGSQDVPPVPKIGLTAFTFGPIWFYPRPRGTHLAATIDFRILDTALQPDSTCPDTLMKAFTPTMYLGFVNLNGQNTYLPSFSTDCIRATEYYCGDTNADGRITSADIVYMGNYIYRHGPDPLGEADVNLDGRITVADAIYLGNYIYRRGPEPCNPL